MRLKLSVLYLCICVCMCGCVCVCVCGCDKHVENRLSSYTIHICTYVYTYACIRIVSILCTCHRFSKLLIRSKIRGKDTYAQTRAYAHTHATYICTHNSCTFFFFIFLFFVEIHICIYIYTTYLVKFIFFFLLFTWSLNLLVVTSSFVFFFFFFSFFTDI